MSTTPDVVADPGRPLAREPLPGNGSTAVVEAVVGVGDQAAVGEHAVRADVDERERSDHHPEVQKAPLPIAIRAFPGSGDPDVGFEQNLWTYLEATLVQRLEHVAVEWPPSEGLAPGEFPVDSGPVPRQRVLLIPPPLLSPEPRRRQIHGATLPWRLRVTADPGSEAGVRPGSSCRRAPTCLPNRSILLRPRPVPASLHGSASRRGWRAWPPAAARR